MKCLECGRLRRLVLMIRRSIGDSYGVLAAARAALKEHSAKPHYVGSSIEDRTVPTFMPW